MEKLIVPCLSEQQRCQLSYDSSFSNSNDLTQGIDPGKDIKGSLTCRLSMLYYRIPCRKIKVKCLWALFLLSF